MLIYLSAESPLCWKRQILCYCSVIYPTGFFIYPLFFRIPLDPPSVWFWSLHLLPSVARGSLSVDYWTRHQSTSVRISLGIMIPNSIDWFCFDFFFWPVVFGSILDLRAGSWSSRECIQTWDPSSVVDHKLDQSLVGHFHRFCTMPPLPQHVL